MRRWFDARSTRERWLVTLGLWSAVILWVALGDQRIAAGWRSWQTSRDEAGLRSELDQRRHEARTRLREIAAQSPEAGDVVAGLAAAVAPLRLEAEEEMAAGLPRWTLTGEAVPMAAVVEVYRRVHALGGNVRITEAVLTAAATEGTVDCRLTVRAWLPTTH